MQSGILLEKRWTLNMQPMPLAWRRSVIHALSAIAIVGLTISLTSLARAADLVTNGDFTQVVNGSTSRQVGQNFSSACSGNMLNCGIGSSSMMPQHCTVGSTTNPCIPYALLTGWTTRGLILLFNSGPFAGNPDGGGATFQYTGGAGGTVGPQTFQLWSDRNCSEAMPGTVGCTNARPIPNSSPNGGNFIAMDGGNTPNGVRASITETINNLIPGVPYDVKWVWASGQQQGPNFNGDTMEQLRVSLCTPSQAPGYVTGTTTSVFGTPGLSGCIFYTNRVTNEEHGFTNWSGDTFEITPTASSEVLNFLALGTPSSVPPVVLLDSVSVTEVPEPCTLSLLGIGFAGLAGNAYRRLRRLGGIS